MGIATLLRINRDRHRSATRRSGWIVEHGSETPKLTTCYPL
ncbi:MAG: DUF6883 domain-containing protein [Cyanobacteria bacterium P01_C01_bin.120]